MKRSLSLLLTALVLTATTSAARADEDDKTQLEFIHGLRERHMSKEALEWLEILKKTGSPTLVKMIPVEIARTKIFVARELEPEQRKKLFEEARQALANYAKANEGTPAAAQARLEMARIATYEAQAAFSQAQRQDDRASMNEFARKAEDKFKQAGAELEGAYKALPPSDQLMVKFEMAKNLLDQAQTILDRSKQVESSRRAKLIETARLALEAIEKEAGKNEKAEALHLARAWLFKVNKGENLDADAAKKYLKKVLNADDPAAAAAQRLVQSYIIQHYAKDPDVKETGVTRLHTIQRDAQQWLKTNRGYRNSPEGFAVRFALANAFLSESQEIGRDPKFSKDKKKQVAADKLKTAALKEFTELAASDSEFQEEAANYLTNLSIQRINNVPLASLTNADDCFLKARYERFKMGEAASQAAKTADKDKRAELEKQREVHEVNVIRAYQRGIDLARNTASLKDRVKKIGEAQYYLTYLYLQIGALAEAAKLGEEVARDDAGQTKYSPLIAGYAIDAYSRLMNNEKEAPQARKKLMEFADFIAKKRQAAWQGQQVLQVALYQHAAACVREKNDLQIEDPTEKYHKEIELTWKAIDLFGKVSPEFYGYDYAQYQKAYVAMLGMKHVDKHTERDPKKAKKEILLVRAKERAAFQDVFLKTMKALKPIGPNTDPGTVRQYFTVRIEEANMVFVSASTLLQQENFPEAAKKYAELGDLTARMKKDYALVANKLEAALRDGYAQTITALDNRVRLGLGNIDYRASQFAKVLSPPVTGQVVAEIKKRGQTEKGDIIVADDRVICGLLGLALRSNVQLGKVADAMEVLELLRRTHGDKGALDIAGEELETLIRELKIQIRELKNDKTKLDATVKHFTLFLNELAKGKGGAAGGPGDLVFLGNFYAGLNNYKEAAKYFEKVARPKIDEKKKLEKLDKKEVKELIQFFQMRVNYGRMLRLDKQLPEAKKVLEGVLSDPQSLGKFLAQKELAHLEEDAGRFGNAVTAWGKFMTNKTLEAGLSDPGKTVAEQTRLKELYFDGYYHLAYCNFMYGKNYVPKDKKADKKGFFIQRAADYIHKLETSGNREGWNIAGQRFIELITNEPLLYAQPTMIEILRKYNKKK